MGASGTGTSTTTGGTVAVECDDGFSGSGDAVCTADASAETATFLFTDCLAATCASIDVANSDKDARGVSRGVRGTGTSMTTGTVAVTCDAGYSGSGDAVC